MWGLPAHAWERFGIWMALGLALYFAYGYKHSTLRRGRGPVPLEPPPSIEP
jgi:APA family basic amino acid/polyamine antiporter